MDQEVKGDTVTISKREYDLLIKRLGGKARVNWLLLGQKVIDNADTININPDKLINHIDEMWSS